MSFKTIFIYIVFLLSFLNLQAQKETWHWYFGGQAGIDFTSGSPIADTNGKIGAGEGVSSISDSIGDLLFYTDGMSVWNKIHVKMDNGTGLLGNRSSSQSSIVVKQPNNDSIYYIFTTDAYESYNFFPPHKGFRYSIVNTKKNNGLGKVTIKNVWIADSSCERITAVQHCNRKDMWIIAAKANSNKYMAYLLSDTGLNMVPVISQNGPLAPINALFWSCTAGYMKASPNGSKIAVVFCCENHSVSLFDFDNATGLLSNPIPVGFSNPDYYGSYAAEFSPNQKYIYITYASGGSGHGHIYQYDISSNNPVTINLSGIELYWNYTHPNTYSEQAYALQLACDKKIYIAFAFYAYVGVINSPDSAGLACNFVKNGVFLNGKLSSIGLPTFFPGYFKPVPDFTYTQNCLNIVFKPNCDSAALDSIRWNFGDVASGSNTSALYSPTHLFSDTGIYTIKVIYYYPCNMSDTVLKTISVQLPAYTFSPSYITDSITNLCKQLRFTAVCDSAALDSLRWNFGDIASGSTNTSGWFHPLHTFSDTGSYNVSLILYAYCRSDTIYKTVHIALPINGVYLGADTTLCSGEVLQLGGAIPSPLPISYLWQNGSLTPGFTVSQAGTYWQQVNAGGCLFSDTINISYLDPPTISLPNDTIICEDSRIDVQLPQGNYSLLWDNGSTFFNRSFTQAGNYWLTATNICGNATDAFVLQSKNCNCYLYFPNAFTPDGNDLNACFAAVYDCAFETYHLFIYNRWGQLLFQTTNPAECWDGKYKNETVLPDVYVWILEYKSVYDGTVIGKKGIVTVVK